MLGPRILTALVLLIGFGGGLFFASVDLFALLLASIVAAAAWEWSRLSGVTHEHAQTAFACLAGVLSLIALYIPHNETLLQWLLLAAFIFWLGAAALLYAKPVKPAFNRTDSRGNRTDSPGNGTDSSGLVTALFIMVTSAVAMQYLRSFAESGSVWLLLYALSVTWVMDTGAYFSGKRFGRRKLASMISPGKTIEGVIGGLLLTLALMLIVALSVPWAQDARFKLFVATLLAAAASVLGDLYESRLKRAAGCKDSSALLPGHGGVLDRVDGVVAAIPVFAFIWVWL